MKEYSNIRFSSTLYFTKKKQSCTFRFSFFAHDKAMERGREKKRERDTCIYCTPYYI